MVTTRKRGRQQSSWRGGSRKRWCSILTGPVSKNSLLLITKENFNV